MNGSSDSIGHILYEYIYSIDIQRVMDNDRRDIVKVNPLFVVQHQLSQVMFDNEEKINDQVFHYEI